jgi:ABC-type multidrug transport system ATPase subunit
VTSSTPDALWESAALQALHPSAIACAGVTRGRLLDRCTLTVPVGMRLLLVGQPNASSSTLVRILAGLSRVKRGRIEIAGLSDPTADGWGRRVAYLGPNPGIHRWMTPREALELAARLLELPGVDAARRLERALAWVRIPEGAVDRPVRRGGPPLLQRTGLAAALMADPEVLLLDEPLRALEAHERSRLLRLPGKRRTVVLASHYPASEEGLASHVAFIRDGRVALMSPVADLEALGLSLSMRDILALAALRAGERGDPTRRQAPAAAR